ncbi:phage tail protein [Enterobacter bugandensis]|uniref:phage tail protein n=1 Tax=Enterobacter bugandensis TaxID=881260 RepID=UPI002FD3BC83
MSDVLPELNHRFMAFFCLGALPDLISTRFQNINGLSRQMEVQRVREGGFNTGNRYLPQGVSSGNLTFERGVMTISPLSVAFDFILSSFNTGLIELSADIMLLSERGVPVATWCASRALPVRMSIGPLDANSGQVLINTMEITCQRIEWLGLKL